MHAHATSHGYDKMRDAQSVAAAYDKEPEHIWGRSGRMGRAIAEAYEDDACRTCGETGGPWPKGDRPKSSNPLPSGCPRCGYCL